MKYVLWALLLYVGWRWYLSKNHRPPRHRRKHQRQLSHPRGGRINRKMVSCAHCGIHLPLSESVQGTGELHFVAMSIAYVIPAAELFASKQKSLVSSCAPACFAEL